MSVVAGQGGGAGGAVPREAWQSDGWKEVHVACCLPACLPATLPSNCSPLAPAAVHLTGSAATHDAIVWQGKPKQGEPPYQKPVGAELG